MKLPSDLSLWRTEFAATLEGPIVPIMPAFSDDGSLDVPSLRRFLRRQIAAGTRHFWTTPGTSHYYSLTDDEVRELTRAVAAETAGKATYIASTCFHWPVDRCRAFIREAAAWGVDVVKVVLNWELLHNPVLKTTSEEDTARFMGEVAVGSPIPLFSYTLGKPGITDSLLERLVSIPEYIGLKNDSGDYEEQAHYLDVLGSLAPGFTASTGGSMASHLSNAAHGDRLYAVALGIIKPEVPLEFHRVLHGGDAARATRIVETEEAPVATFIAGFGNSHWSFYRAALHLTGIYRTPVTRFPYKTPTREQITAVGDFLGLEEES